MLNKCFCHFKTHQLGRADGKEILLVRSEVLTMVLLKDQFFWDMML
jgi:hypothetical protein